MERRASSPVLFDISSNNRVNPEFLSNTSGASTSASRPPSAPASADGLPPSRLRLATGTARTGLTLTRRAKRIATPRAPAHLLCLAVRDIEERRLSRSRFQSRYGQGRKASSRPGSHLLQEHRCAVNHSATPTARSQPQTVYRTPPAASIA